jgi:hypothetical protein
MSGKDKHRDRYHAESYPLPPGFGGKLAMPYRWFSGQPLNGHRYTDATGFRYGTRGLDPSGHANVYQLLPGYKRFLYVRLPITLSPAAAVTAALEPGPTSLALGAAGLYGFHAIGQYWETRVFRREVVEPVAIGLSGVMKKGHIKGRGYEWVLVPEDFRDTEDASIRIRLPLDWLAEVGDRKRLVELVSTRLNMEDLSPTWHMERGQSWVDLKVPPKPPRLVTFQEAMADMAAASEDGPVMGYGARGKLVTFELKLESPHLLIAGGSGAGKSELIAAIVAQFMRWGYGVLVCDAKFTSHMWLRKVPGVAYASEAEELHDALMWLDGELLRRARLVSKSADPKAASASLEPIVAVLEEINGATNRLRAYWKTIKGPEDPMMSPALTAMGNLSSMGRELRIHIIMAGQSVTAKASAGAENRENFGARALARATSAQWRMLAPQIKPAPTKRLAAGRWHLVVGDALRELQAPFMDLKCVVDEHAEARLIEWATGGQPMPDVAAMILEAGVGGTRFVDLPRQEAVPPSGISLRQYADEAGLELKTLTRWRERRSDFPVESSMGANNTKLYERDHLRAYVRERQRENA